MADYEHILAVKKSLQPWLLALPGVHAVSVGEKVTNGKPTGELAIVVSVVSKKPLSQLPQAEVVPPEVDGEKTDVIEVQESYVLDDTSKYRPLQGGVQITSPPLLSGSGDWGTLGCIVRTDEPQPKYLALTNHHVVGLPSGPPNNLQVTPAGAFSAIDATQPTGKALVVAKMASKPSGTTNATSYYAFYQTSATDTPNLVAQNLQTVINGLSDSHITASVAGATISLTSDPGYDVVGSFAVFRIHPGGGTPHLSASVAGNVITLTGDVDADGYGIFTNCNLGGQQPSFGVFTAVTKGSALSAVAQDIVNALTNLMNTLGITGVSVSQTFDSSGPSATITVDKAEELECDVKTDLRIGQADDQFCSSCCKCWDDRIGTVLDSRLDLDIALIQLDGGMQYLAQIVDLGLTGVVSGTYNVKSNDTLGSGYAVTKRGRTTLETSGYIKYLNQDGWIADAHKTFHRFYSGAMSITTATAGVAFSCGGDSGSAIVDSNENVVGILFGGNCKGGNGLAIPIAPILSGFSSLSDLIVETATIPDVVHTVPGAAMVATAPIAATPASTQRLAQVQQEITATSEGQVYAALVQRHSSEAMELINNNRRVAATWRRNNGPAILQAVIDMLYHKDRRVPPQIQGKPVAVCLQKVKETLARYASPAFASDLNLYGRRLLDFIGLTYPEFLCKLQFPRE